MTSLLSSLTSSLCSNLFSIDPSKARADGLKIPAINIVDKTIIVPLISEHAALINCYFDCYIVPNAITICSLLVRTVGLVCLYYDDNASFVSASRRVKRIIAAACFFAGYYLDCLDGFYARKYNKCTMFGCWLDHINDIVTSLAFYVLVIAKKMWTTAALMTIMFIFVVNQVLIEEEMFDNHTEFFGLVMCYVSQFRIFDTPDFLEWFGTSSWFLIVAFAIAIE